MRALLLIGMLAACESGAKKPAPPSAGSDVPAQVTNVPAQGSTAEKLDAKAANAGPRTPPKVDNGCDGGCVVTDITLDGDDACCSGCGQSAVNATSYKAFQEWCKTSPAPQCPPLGCAMEPMHAVCEAGHCVAKSMRDIPKPSP